MANCSNLLPSRDQWPVGFRFYPTDEELINHYLKNKVFGNDSLVAYIPQIDVCKYEPADLPRLLNDHTGTEKWFFFSTLDFRNCNISRCSRITNSGFWKSTGNDRKIMARGTNESIGTKKTLVFHRGRTRNANRTNWVIHEYRLPTDIRFPNSRPFVICRLKKKSDMNVSKFDEPNGLVNSTIENVNTANGIQQSSPPWYFPEQPVRPDSGSIDASDGGVNRQPIQPVENMYFDPIELLNLCSSPPQPALPDFQPINASDEYFDDGTSKMCRFPLRFEHNPALMDFQHASGNAGEVNNQPLRPGASESEISLTEFLNSVLENENNDEVTSTICMDCHNMEEPSDGLLEYQYDGFSCGTDNAAAIWWQDNHIPPSRLYRCVGSTMNNVLTVKELDNQRFQYREEKEIYSHELLRGSSCGSIVSTRNVFSCILTTKRVQHKSSHPLVYAAKAFLGIILFVLLAQEVLLHGNWC